MTLQLNDLEEHSDHIHSIAATLEPPLITLESGDSCDLTLSLGRVVDGDGP